MSRRKALKNVAREAVGRDIEEILGVGAPATPPAEAPTPPAEEVAEAPTPPTPTPGVSIFIPTDKIPAGMEGLDIGASVTLSIEGTISTKDETGITIDVTSITA